MTINKKIGYSIKEREEFEKLILEKLKKAKKDFVFLKESFVNDQNNGTDDTSPTFKVFEEGAETLSKEQNAQLISHIQKLISNLENALLRVKIPDYGICSITGNIIPKERLKAIPYTTLSIEGIQIIEGKKIEKLF
ncbi:MAG: TraR/DksA C4-type zinc finger protein [Candidatus Bostrichicola ureolyticus]|nr:MAG: TraR/DksA C4-type zinc finger protein [Candidatus Bostrichicola ureolyticus]